MTIRLSGLSSGLDTETLVSKLMELERMPLTQMQQRNTLLQSRKTDFSSIKSNFFSLQTKITDLTYASAFKAKISSSSDEKVATASVQNGSVNASYTIQVVSTATATRNTGAALAFGSGTKATRISTAELNTTALVDANPNAAFNSGTTNLESAVNAGYFYINNQRIDVLATDTINTVLNKITDSSAGVTATLSGDKITLTQKSSGSTPTVTLGSDTSGFLTAAKLTAAVVTPGTNTDETKLLKDTALGATLTNGYFSINGAFIAIDKDTDTLMSVINKINQSTTAGVTAFYDSVSKKISLTSKTTGNGSIVLGTNPGTDTSNFLSQVGLVQGNEVLGSNGSVKVNGVDVTPVNNQVSLNGVTFTIKSAGTATITVKNDVDSMVAKVKAFIEQYNSVIDQINGELTEEKVKSPQTNSDLVKGNLRGDSLLVNARAKLRSFVYTVVTSQPSSLQQLSQIGISTGAVNSSVGDAKVGHLVLDETKLRSALETNSDLVASLFGKGTASSADENLGTGNGATTTYTLAHTPVSSAPAPQIKVNGVAYTLVSGTPSSAAGSKEYAINYATGQITFGEAPAAGLAITATYDYDITSGSGAGIAVQMKSFLGEMTRVGGTFDTRIGSNGSLTNTINYNQKRMDDLEARLKLREQALYRQFSNLETIMNNLKSQSSWLTSQLAGLSGNSSSSK